MATSPEITEAMIERGARAIHLRHGLDCAYQVWDGEPRVLQTCGACEFVARACILAALEGDE